MKKFVRPNIEAVRKGLEDSTYPDTTQIFGICATTGDPIGHGTTLDELKKCIEKEHPNTEYMTMAAPKTP